ncbi:MAG TPA: DNA internalization-related competence protein ComEC/Rec2 [Candidatus Lustribacter sp.]|nr:DNA internalization-related competence protein ComEC/Rec2 [Candidatus Lustribacter sp.]
MRRAPLLVPAAVALLAIVAEQHGWALSAFIAVGCGCTLAYKGRRSARVAVALACGAGVAFSALRGHPPVLTNDRATARYAATVIGDVKESDSGLSSTVLEIAGVGAVRASLRERVAPGERLVVRGRLEPFDEPRNPGEPSMREIERDDGFVARLASAHLLARAPPDPRDINAWAARLRAAASRRIRAVIPEPSATILAGALWGERGTLPDELHAAFQATGTVHVLVTAGLHLGIVAALAAFLLSRLGLYRAVACAIALTLIVAYAWFTGAHLPSERAAAMIGTALLARACGARVTSWNALAMAALVVAFLWPAAVESASFALSFSCVAAIVLFADVFAHLLHGIPVHERIREALALTCATQIGTWPLTAAVFSTLAPYAVLANALVVPLVALVLTGGIATLVLPLLAPLETLLLLLVEGIVRTIAALPGAQATLATPPLALILVYDAAAVAAAVALRRGRKIAGLAILTAASVTVALPSIVHLPHGLEITHLDVGQGDGAVIRTPHDHVILIDTGGELERPGITSNAEAAGARIVLAYLRRAGIRSIDLMLLTHPHGDHVGGCAPIIDAMPVRLLFDSGQQYSGRAFQDCMHEAATHGVQIVRPQRGYRWTDDDVTLDILAPSLPTLADTGDDINENSIVAMLHYNDFRELFMGDAGESSEARLLASGTDLRANVLKVGHHGSEYASTPPFIAAVHPQDAIISVGRHNTFGHPGPSTLATLERAGTTIYRTDRCGAVVITVGKEISTMVPCELPRQ